VRREAGAPEDRDGSGRCGRRAVSSGQGSGAGCGGGVWKPNPTGAKARGVVCTNDTGGGRNEFKQPRGAGVQGVMQPAKVFEGLMKARSEAQAGPLSVL